MYQQNNSPSRSYQANVSLGQPSSSFNAQGPQVNLQGPGNQFSSGIGSTSNQYSAQNTSVNLSGPGSLGQGPSLNVSGPGQYSSSSHQSSFNTQGPSVSLSGPGSRDYNQQSSFNTQGPSLSLNSNDRGNDYNRGNDYHGGNNGPSLQGNLSGPEVNVNMGGQGGNFSMNGPQDNYGGNMGGGMGGYGNEAMPTSSEGIRQYITKRPYTQNIDGENITYSIIPKKQKSFVMTHDRFLLLKGIEILGYAREFPQGKTLPFYGLADVPAPKTVIPLTMIMNVEVQDDKLMVNHADKEKTVWEFHCPSKRCAVEWKQKINEAMERLREYNNSSFNSPAEFYQFQKGNIGMNNSPPPMESPPREPPKFNSTLNSSPPRVEANLNYRVNHDDEVSRSVYDNSGPKASPTRLNNTNITSNNNYQFNAEYNTQGSPVKTNQYEVNYQVNQSSPQGMNANYQNSNGGSTYHSSTGGRSYTISSNSSFGRYPMGMPVGNQPQVMQGRSNYRNV